MFSSGEGVAVKDTSSCETIAMDILESPRLKVDLQSNLPANFKIQPL